MIGVFRRCVAALMAVALTCGIARAGDLRSDVETIVQANFAEYLELLSQRNVASEPADIVRNARFLRAALMRRALDARLVDNPAGRPVVLGELRVDPALPTVLFYAHYDGQPVVDAEWSQKDPFVPIVRRREAGEWRDVGAAAVAARPFDPELRVFARSSSDDKAPIAMLLWALDLLARQGKTPAFNIKVMLDGEEEMGSPSLKGVVAGERKAFAADALVIADGPVHESGRPTLAFGNRGIAQATLTVYGPRAPLHSGHYGNYAPNPVFRLSALLASMKGDDGRVLIPGYYDGVELSAADRAALAAVGDDEEALRRRLGISEAERVGNNYQESLQYPSLNVRGLAAAGVGASAANVVPAQAVAELDLRTTPDTDGRRLFELVRQHIERQGYTLVDDPPSDADRAGHQKLASFTLGSVQPASRMPMNSPIGRWARAALASPVAPEPKREPVLIRMMGGTVPTDVLVDALDLPFVLVPTVNGDNNQHARDENLRLGNLVTGTETMLALLTTPLSAGE